MEMTFYDDNMFRSSGKNDGKSLKRPATLDLDSPDTASKKQQRLCNILTSPDLHMLKLASPELERFIISNGNITTTPTPTQFLFSKNVTEEQEQYARGFLDALNQLHQTQFEMSSTGLIARISTGTTPVSGVPPEFPAGTTVMSSPTLSKLYGGITPFYLRPASTTCVIKSLGNAKNTSPTKLTSLIVRPPSSESNNVVPSRSSANDNARTSMAPRSSAADNTRMTSIVVRPPSVDSSCNSNSMSSNSALQPLEIAIKEEYQTVPSDFSSPPLSPLSLSKGPIDMADQERIKLERKRYRNRVAASKCRKRKLEKISHLEDKVKELKGENSKLELTVEKLREQVCFLKQEVLDHAKKGCQIYLTKH